MGSARERGRLLAVVGLGNLALHRNILCASISTVNKYSGMFEKFLDLYRLWQSQGHVAPEMRTYQRLFIYMIELSHKCST